MAQSRPVFNSLFPPLILILILIACCAPAPAQGRAAAVAPAQGQPAQGSGPQTYLKILAQAQAKTGSKEWAEAAGLWEQVVESNPVNGNFWNQLANARYQAKDYKSAIAAYQKVIELGFGFPSNAAYNIACCYALTGDKEQALKWLDKSFEMGFRDLKNSQEDTDLQSLRDDPRYRKIVGLAETGKMSRDEGWQYDLQLLAREVRRKAYSPAHHWSSEDFETEAKNLNDAIPKLTDMQIVVGMMKLMRKVGDGHTGIIGSTERAEFLQSLPLQFYLFKEGLYIISADPKYRDLLGAQVLRFGDRTVDEVMQALDPLMSRDNEIWPSQVGPYRMRNLSLLNALGLIPDAQKVQLTIRDGEGKTRAVTLQTDTSEPNIWNTLPNPKTWINLPQTAPGPIPLYLKDMGTNYWFEYLPDSKMVYFQYNKVINGPQESLAQFTERLFKFINEHEVEKLVIDMRWNNGGNTFLEMPLIHALISNAKINREGKLFVVIGRRTFSAAQNGATFIERNTKAIFVGEPTGSSPNFVGEETIFTLPYSRIQANVSDLYWQSSWPFDYRTWIAPQIYTPPSFEAYRLNRDPAMEAIMAYHQNP
ncbi:MAG TPA: tetratricopeptide repeat protein [Pyrinomonadaceae bacterium]|jgi:tetratricopeptide (TPR) repeat protein|nr:tetratricopeptide repeat protein [Pyrinomonadaceae bacterium]